MPKSPTKQYFTPALRRLEAAAWVLVGGSLAYTAVMLPGLPDEVPHHFGIGGKPDAWGPPESYLLVPVIMLLVLGIMSLVMHFVDPRHWNAPPGLSDEERPRWYRMSAALVVVIELVLAVFTCLLQLALASQAVDAVMPLCLALVLVLSAAIVATLVAWNRPS